MIEPRLKAGIWVSAHMRLCDRELLSCVVLRRGDADAGGVLLKVNRLGAGCSVFGRHYDGDGNLAWMDVAGGPADGPDVHRQMEGACDEYISREISTDPDLWVLEIEDPRGVYSPEKFFM